MGKALDKISEMTSKGGRLERWLLVEGALANAQSRLGIIPPEAAKEIARCAHISAIDTERYDELYEKTKHPMVSMLKLLEEAAGAEAGQYIHLGATTQDIIDTAVMLMVKETMENAVSGMTLIIRAACALAEDHADTIMMGRTHNVHALPITFGYKAAIWADELYRCLERIEESLKRIPVLQLSGAVGSMVAFGNDGAEIQRLMANELGLSVPDICWHACRDRYGEFAAVMSLTGCALARIAGEIYLLMGTEYGELSEYWGEGRVGSSTMPHKVNPVNSQHIIGKATALRYRSAEIQELMPVDHERNMQHSLEEEKAIEEICLDITELLERGEDLLTNLVVNEENMLRNVKKLGGLTQSENVMLELGKKTGKQNAHRLVNKIAVEALQNGLDFEEELIKNKAVAEALDAVTIHRLLDPFRYLGDCPAAARNTTAKLRKKLDGR